MQFEVRVWYVWLCSFFLRVALAIHLISWCLKISMHSLGVDHCLKEKLHAECGHTFLGSWSSKSQVTWKSWATTSVHSSLKLLQTPGHCVFTRLSVFCRENGQIFWVHCREESWTYRSVFPLCLATGPLESYLPWLVVNALKKLYFLFYSDCVILPSKIDSLI